VEHGAAGDVALERQLQGPADVVDVRVVTRCRAVAVDDDGLFCIDGTEEQRHRAFLAGAPGPVDVRETKRHRGKAIGLRKSVGVALPRQLARPVGRDGLWERALVDRRHGVADQGAAGGGEHDPTYAGAPGGVEHLECAEDVDTEICRRILDRHDDRARGGEMHDRLNPDKGTVDSIGISDVAFDDLGLDAFKVRHMTGAQIVEDAHLVAAARETPDETRTHETGATCDEDPSFLSHLRSRAEVSRQPGH
jgi:hypothetical protein